MDTHEESMLRIVEAYRQDLQARRARSVDDVIAQYPELGSELRRRLQALQSQSAVVEPQRTVARPPADDLTLDWDPAATNNSAPAAAERHRFDPCALPESAIGDYRLVRELGRGGMGVVFEAEHVLSGRRLALKMLSPDLPRTPETTERFFNEASLAATLSHPHTTFVYEVGQHDGQHFICMELMPGRTLKDVVEAEGALPVNRAVDYLLDALAGLQAAHEVGIVHRDVKPSNCFLDDHGRVKIGDFGLSKSLVIAADLTQTGKFLGTPQFAAPEQFGRGNVDGRTDIFAAGATLYYLLSGAAPFKGDAAAVIAQIVADDPPPLTQLNAAVPRSLSKIVAKALSKEPSRRFRNVSEFRRALAPFSTEGTSLADVGRRVAAFFIDITLVSIVTSIIVVVYVVGSIIAQTDATNVGDYVWMSGLTWLLYFAISEGRFGRSLGKSWLHLRVVDACGEPPGILRALLRAIIVPGLSWMMIDFLQWSFEARMESGEPLNVTAWNSVILSQAFTLAKGVLCLLVCSSMRRRNGFRGLHEFASGTRVVRQSAPEPIEQLSAAPSCAAAIVEDLPAFVGPYRVSGKLGAHGSTQVLAARDEQLGRKVWLNVHHSPIAQSRARRHVARSTRQRWLSEGTQGDLVWQAYEAIEGSPLPEVVRYATIPWGVAREAWVQTADELQAAVTDGTLPVGLSVGQIWVDAKGSIKVSDFALLQRTTCDAASSSNMANASCASEPDAIDNERRALQLLCDVATIFTDDDETPAEALDLRYELGGDATTRPSLSAVQQRLRGVVGRPYRLRWDDRLGILAISIGLETLLLGAPSLVAGSLLASYDASLGWAVGLASAAGFTVAAMGGYVSRGGLAFWLTRIQVCDRVGQPASRCRCAWRNLVAWSLLIVLQALLGKWTIDVARVTDEELGIEFAVLGLYQLVLLLVLIIGLFYAVVQPRRGLQDLAAGTRLVRRSE